MPTIHLLSQDTIDQIAAGEVVERPLSVVKELTENAIDAGANAITVEIREGGLSLIRVTDNGCGMEKEQLPRAFLRHATSKISSIEDLSCVTSLGFRGEALSSIAAVAQVEVITKTREELTGVRYAIAGGKEEELQEVGAPSGTTFLVRNLFFNTPARKKFLKQPQTEGGYVSDMMEHLALSHPEISLKFINHGQERFHTSGNGDLKEVIYRIYGKEAARALIAFTHREEEFQVSGFLGKPELNRANRNFETLFVNGRYVRNEILTKAMEEGYRSFLMQHKFPFFVLHFQMEPDSIDVNVHPAKMEIRLHRGREIYEKLSCAVSNALHETELIPSISLDKEAEEEKQPSQRTPEPFEVRRLLREESATLREEPTVLREEPAEYRIPPAKILGAARQEGVAGEARHSNIIKAQEHILVEKPQQLNLFEEKFLTPAAREQYHILGQLFDTYWLIEYQEKLYLIDQHAAHEKVKYERLTAELANRQVSAQMLNPPVILSLTSREEETLRDFWDYFTQMGFEIEEFGGGSVALRSMPTELYGCKEKEFFTELLDALMADPMKGQPEVILQKLSSMACKAAVKGNSKMTGQEAEALIDELLSLKEPYHCPHGRPTMISMSKSEIEKKFKRIV